MARLAILCIALTITSASSFAVGGPSLQDAAPRPRVSLSVASIDAEVLTREDRLTIAKPAIHWTVPGFKVGWQDEEGNWFDEDGPRKGPPLNYWRQSADEREYNVAMDAADAVLSQYDVVSTVSKLEKRNSARKPSLNRKVLGRWAPLLLSGRRVPYGDKPLNYDGEVEVPFVVDISRSNGRRFGPRNHYGVFDATLEDGEELTVSTVGGIANISGNIIANQDNEVADIGSTANLNLRFGGITYISDYIMIQRGPDEAIDFFLRADDSYLGITDEEVAKQSYEIS